MNHSAPNRAKLYSLPLVLIAAILAGQPGLSQYSDPDAPRVHTPYNRISDLEFHLNESKTYKDKFAIAKELIPLLVKDHQKQKALDIAYSAAQDKRYDENPGFQSVRLGEEFEKSGEPGLACELYNLAIRQRADVFGWEALADTAGLYSNVSRLATSAGLSAMAEDAHKQATQLKRIADEFKLGTLSESNLKKYFPAQPESDARKSGIYYMEMSEFRAKQNRNLEACRLAREGLEFHKLQAADDHSDQSGLQLPWVYCHVGNQCAKAGNMDAALEAWHSSADIILAHQPGWTPFCEHLLELLIKIADGENRDPEYLYTVVFPKASNYFLQDQPKSLYFWRHSKDIYVEYLTVEADKLEGCHRHDLAVAVFVNGIEKLRALQAAEKGPETYLGAAQFGYYDFLLHHATDAEARSVIPVCPRCLTNAAVHPDRPEGDLILSDFHWRCHTCDTTF